jgi:hypothetical protein
MPNVKLAIGVLSTDRKHSQIPEAALRLRGLHTAVSIQHKGNMTRLARRVLNESGIFVFDVSGLSS